MRDTAKRYLVETYLSDWAPKPVHAPPTSSTTRKPTAPRPEKASKGFFDDTGDEGDEDEFSRSCKNEDACSHSQCHYLGLSVGRLLPQVVAISLRSKQDYK